MLKLKVTPKHVPNFTLNSSSHISIVLTDCFSSQETQIYKPGCSISHEHTHESKPKSFLIQHNHSAGAQAALLNWEGIFKVMKINCAYMETNSHLPRTSSAS